MGTRFEVVESSPRERATRTVQLAGLRAEVNHDLVEWDYGDLEGLTLEEIRASYPGWTIWDGPWPGGETASQVAARADRVVERVLSLPPGANALMITHGHMLRMIAARWLRQPPAAGRLFIIGTATISVLGWEHGEPAVQCWNARPSPAPMGEVPAATVAH
jgi:probable phosphoglycerate mutase